MGKLYGIGVGPGGGELLTLKAHKILNEADVIFCPEKEEGAGSYALEIVKDALENKKAEIVTLVYPMHYHGEQLRKIWEENGKEIAGRLQADKTGAFITIGDPSVYSTFMYTLPYIEKYGIETEVVPGITSFCAAACISKTPLSAGLEDLVIAPMKKNSAEQLDRLFKEHDNIVLMKPSTDKQSLVEAMKKNHLEDKFFLISKAGTAEENIITDFRQLESCEIPYLSTIIIKKKGFL